jgi:hypothetical protein
MKKRIHALLLALVFATQATATVVLVDDFNYRDGALVGAPWSPWVAHSVGGSQAIQVTNAVRVVGASGSAEDVNAPLAAAPYLTNSAAVLYVSFKVRFTALPTATGTYFAHFRDDATGFRCRVWASTVNATPETFRLGIGNGTQANASSGQIAQDLALDTPYTVVTRLIVSNTLSTIWLDPTAESDPGVTASDAAGDSTSPPVNISTYALRQSSGGGTCWIDNLRIGTSFQEVAGPNNPPSITVIKDQRAGMGAIIGPLQFLVSDAETARADLVLTAHSSNPSLLPDDRIEIGAIGTTNTVTLRPRAGEEGTTTVTLGVTDGGGITSVTTFKALVGFPYISCLPAQIIPEGTSTGPIPFTIGQVDTPPDSLLLSVASSNPTLAPETSVVISGSGSDRTVNVTPVSGRVGLAVITVSVSDGVLTSSSSFSLTVQPLTGLLLDEPFSYPDGTPIADGSTPWTNHSGILGQTIVSNGSVLLSFTNTEDFHRDLPGGPFYPAQGMVVFASFKINFSELPGQAGAYFAHYIGAGFSDYNCRLFAAAQPGSPGLLRLGIAGRTGDGGVVALHPAILGTNADYTVVTRYDLAAGTCTLWINPISDLSPSVDAFDLAATTQLTAIALRQSSGIGALTVDHLKVGTSFFDVVPNTVSQHPELVIARRCDPRLQLTWQAELTGFVLQHSPSTSGPWAAYSDQGAVLGYHRVVVLRPEADQEYFRLQKP